MLVSPARRTQETLARLEPWDETPLIEPMEALYLASAQQLLAVLRDVNETVRSVLLIGHNPGMHELAVMLAGTRDADPATMAGALAAGFPTGCPGGIRHCRPLAAARCRRWPPGALPRATRPARETPEAT